PGELLSGDPKKVDEWRLEQAEKRTKEKRPDLLKDDN
ncbi:MAG: tRNA (guanosine(37)-N1)-methyltransferase TrmD, partial [Flavisolibacter sp.]|nr:tRNA (guanosine(37)-N1)-methyltransferase TrmD [Flavisolibacter sp.]